MLVYEKDSLEIPLSRPALKKVFDDLCIVSTDLDDLLAHCNEGLILTSLTKFEPRIPVELQYVLECERKLRRSSEVDGVTAPLVHRTKKPVTIIAFDFNEKGEGDERKISLTPRLMHKADSEEAFGRCDASFIMNTPFMDLESLAHLLNMRDGDSLEARFDDIQKSHAIDMAKKGLPPLWRILWPYDKDLPCGTTDIKRRLTSEELSLYRSVKPAGMEEKEPLKYYFYYLIPDELTVFRTRYFPESYEF